MTARTIDTARSRMHRSIIDFHRRHHNRMVRTSGLIGFQFSEYDPFVEREAVRAVKEQIGYMEGGSLILVPVSESCF